MDPDGKPQNQNVPNYSLKQLAAEFLSTLPPEKRTKSQQEIYRFMQWFGEACPISKLTIPQIENYVQQIHSTTPKAAERLEAIRAFLGYAYKQKLTTVNLATSIKIKKTQPQATPKTPRAPSPESILTQEGYERLRLELEALKKERPRIAEELRKAAADKDLRENAPFEAIKEYQVQVETRIRELEAILKSAKIVATEGRTDLRISLGDTIKLRDLRTGEVLTYTLVDTSEANPREGKISTASPVGQALLGKKEGEHIEVKAPAGTMVYRIEAILDTSQSSKC